MRTAAGGLFHEDRRPRGHFRLGGRRRRSDLHEGKPLGRLAEAERRAPVGVNPAGPLELVGHSEVSAAKIPTVARGLATAPVLSRLARCATPATTAAAETAAMASAPARWMAGAPWTRIAVSPVRPANRTPCSRPSSASAAALPAVPAPPSPSTADLRYPSAVATARASTTNVSANPWATVARPTATAARASANPPQGTESVPPSALLAKARLAARPLTALHATATVEAADSALNPPAPAPPRTTAARGLVCANFLGDLPKPHPRPASASAGTAALPTA